MKSSGRIVLLVAEPCTSCDEAARIWREAAATTGVEIEIRTLDTATAAGAADDDAEAGITALPALLIDDQPLVVGVPRRDAAVECLRRALAERGRREV